MIVGVRQAFARLGRFRRLSLAAVLLFALAISGETVLFSLVDSVAAIARPVIPDAGAVARLHVSRPLDSRGPMSMALFKEFREDARRWGDVAGYTAGSVRITGVDMGLRPATLMIVTPGYFALLGARPAAGRFFGDADSAAAEDPIVLADGFWRRVFDADTGVIGRRLSIGDARYRITGIAPRGFPGPHLPPADAWVPYRWNPGPGETTQPSLWLLARIGPGMSPQRLSQVATESFRRLANSDLAHIAAAPITEPSLEQVPASRTAAGFGLGVAIVILAAAGALVLLRWVQPRREGAMRAALGAGSHSLMAVLAWDLAILISGGVFLAGLIVVATRSGIESYLLADPSRVPLVAPLFGLLAAAAAFGGVLVSLWPVLRITDQPPEGDPSGLVTLFGTQHAPSPAINAAPQLALMKSDSPTSPRTPEPLLGSPRRSLMIASDFRSAYRSLRRSPVFVTVAVLTLGIGIGLTSTMMAVLDSASNPYVPYRNPDQLFEVTAFGGGGGVTQYEKQWALIEGTKSFRGVTSAAMQFQASITIDGQERSGDLLTVADNYFGVLGVPADVGRVLGPGDEGNAVIGYGFWQRMYGSRSLENGLSLTVRGRMYRVVGVMPPEMRMHSGVGRFASAWILIPDPTNRAYKPIVRLRDGVTRQAAYAELGLVADRLRQVYGPGRPQFQFRLDSLQPSPRTLRDYQKALGGAAIAILLIACANLANLMLVRGMARRKELAMRLAIGAGRGHLVRQLFTESALVGLLGGAAGILLGIWGVAIARYNLAAVVADYGFEAPRLGWTFFAVAGAATIGAMLLFGLAPAIAASMVQVSEPLKESSGTTSRKARRSYALVVVGELALCLALLMGSGLLLRAADHAARLDHGYPADQLVLGFYNARLKPGETPVPRRLQGTLERLATVDGVAAVSWQTQAPTRGGAFTSDQEGAEPRLVNSRTYNVVRWDFLRTIGLAVIKGRDFEPGDGQSTSPVAIVSVGTAEALWPGQDPLGRMIKLGSRTGDGEWVRVVGVARAMSNAALGEVQNDPPVVFVVRRGDPEMTSIVARVNGNREVVISRLNGILQGGNPGDGVYGMPVLPWLWQWERQTGGRLALSTLFAGFGLVAVLLAAIGLYGVLSYAVGQRMREFAVRVALGAIPRDLRGLVLRDAAVMILGGTAVGGFLSMAGAPLLEFWLFDVHPTDAISLVSAEAALLLVAFAACLAPAARAAKADPLQIIRAL